MRFPPLSKKLLHQVRLDAEYRQNPSGTRDAVLDLMEPVSFRDLEVWQRTMTLAEDVYAVAALLPKSELLCLSHQLRKSAISIPSNIAEGKQRTTASYINFLRVALGSEAELQTQLELTVRLGFVPRERIRPVLGTASEVGRMLNGLIRSLGASTEPGSDPDP